VLPGIGYPWHPTFDHNRLAGTVHLQLQSNSHASVPAGDISVELSSLLAFISRREISQRISRGLLKSFLSLI